MRKLVFSMVVLFLVSVGVTIVIVFNTNPLSGGRLAIFAFFFCFWISMWSLIFILFSLFIRRKFREKSYMFAQFRRSILAATLITGILILSALGVLNILSGISLVTAGILSELFFINRKLEKVK